MGCNFLAHTAGDAANAVLTAADYNFRRLMKWLALLCTFLLTLLTRADNPENHPAEA
jgi:IS5 family transposase